MRMKASSVTQLEKEIQADIVKLLKTVGAAVYKIGTTRKKERPSGHDADAWDSRPVNAFVQVPWGTHPEMVKASWVQLWIEVKRPGGKLSDLVQT